jgi:hypothetical protein
MVAPDINRASANQLGGQTNVICITSEVIARARKLKASAQSRSFATCDQKTLQTRSIDRAYGATVDDQRRLICGHEAFA